MIRGEQSDGVCNRRHPTIGYLFLISDDNIIIKLDDVFSAGATLALCNRKTCRFAERGKTFEGGGGE